MSQQSKLGLGDEQDPPLLSQYVPQQCHNSQDSGCWGTYNPCDTVDTAPPTPPPTHPPPTQSKADLASSARPVVVLLGGVTFATTVKDWSCWDTHDPCDTVDTAALSIAALASFALWWRRWAV